MRAIQRAEDLVANLERQGVRFSIEGGHLKARPRQLLTPELVATLQTNLTSVAACIRDRGQVAPPPAPEAISPEVRWRVEVMLEQVPERGPIRGLLVCRDGAWPADGEHCVSCGDAIGDDVEGTTAFGGVAVRCAPCREAATIAIESARARR